MKLENIKKLVANAQIRNINTEKAKELLKRAEDNKIQLPSSIKKLLEKTINKTTE